MKVYLDTEDIQTLIDSEELEVEFDPSVFLRIGLKEAVEKTLNEHTARAGSLYQEIRRQVDEYMNEHLPTNVGNYVRTQAHTAHAIIGESVRVEVEAGIRSGIRAFAQKKIQGDRSKSSVRHGFRQMLSQDF